MQAGVKEHYGKCYVTLTSEEQLQGTPEITVRKFDITDDKVWAASCCGGVSCLLVVGVAGGE